MVTLAIRVHTLTPVELWNMAIKRGIVPLDLAKYLAWGAGSSEANYVRELSRLVLAHDKYSASTPPEAAKQLAAGGWLFIITLKQIANFEIGGNATCAACIDAVLHHLLLPQLYTIARAHGLKPVVQEGEHKGVKYVIVAASEAALPEAVKDMETTIEQACKKARLCK